MATVVLLFLLVVYALCNIYVVLLCKSAMQGKSILFFGWSTAILLTPVLLT